jgi:hypothetical protein
VWVTQADTGEGMFHPERKHLPYTVVHEEQVNYRVNQNINHLVNHTVNQGYHLVYILQLLPR